MLCYLSPENINSYGRLALSLEINAQPRFFCALAIFRQTSHFCKQMVSNFYEPWGSELRMLGE